MSRIAAARTLIGMGAVALLAGCLHSPVDQQWGEAYEANTVEQVAAPDAGASLESPTGLGPGTAERVAERYYESQEAESPRQARGVVIGEIQ